MKKYLVVLGGVLTGTYCRSETKKLPSGNRGELIRLAIYTVGRVMYCSLLNLTGLDMRLDPVWLTASTNIGLSASAIDYISHD
jgi:hypothetical protein